MTVRFACPRCQKTLRAPEAGEGMVCPGCLSSVTVPRPGEAGGLDPTPTGDEAAWTPPSELIEEEAAVGALEPGWRAVRRGLALVRWGVGIEAIVQALVSGAQIVRMVEETASWANLVLLAGIVALLVCAIIEGAGALVCCAVPRFVGVRRWAAAALACSVLTVFHIVLAVLASEAMRGTFSQLLAGLILPVVALSSMAAYARGIGRHLRDRGLAARADGWIRVVGYGVLALVIFVFPDRLGPGIPAMRVLSWCLSLAIFVGYIVVVILFLRLLKMTIEAIGKTARAAPEAIA